MPPLSHLLPFRRLNRDSKPGPSLVIPPPSTKPAASTIQPKASISPTSSALQLSSPLFAVLPPEIRLQIYTYLVSPTHTLHIIHQHTKIRRIFQPAARELDFVDNHDVVWHVDHTDVSRKKSNSYLLSALPKRLSSQMACLLVCRKMHDEVLNLLYSTRTVYIDASTPIFQPRTSTPLEHFDKITSLRLMFCSNYASSKSSVNATHWKQSVSVLNQLSNLRSLHILLSEPCWDRFFNLRSRSYDEFHPKRAGWLVYHGLTPWGPNIEVERGIDQIVPYLEWVKDIRCNGEVVVQMFVKRELGAERYAYDLVDELRLRDETFVRL